MARKIYTLVSDFCLVSTLDLGFTSRFIDVQLNSRNNIQHKIITISIKLMSSKILLSGCQMSFN